MIFFNFENTVLEKKIKTVGSKPLGQLPENI